jgi:hypothetical protein
MHIWGKRMETATYFASARVRAKHVLVATVFSVLLLSLIPVSVSSQSGTTVSSRGAIVTAKARALWGVFGTNWCWATKSYVSQHHLDMLSAVKANVMLMELGKEYWDGKAHSNPLGLPFQEYVAEIVRLCHQADPYIYVVLDLMWETTPTAYVSNTGEYTEPQYRANVMRNVEGLRQEWIDFGKDVIQKAKPDGILPMDEPMGPEQYYKKVEPDFLEPEYREFVLDCIEQWRAVDPDIQFWAYGWHFTSLESWSDKPLEEHGYNNIVYFLDRPYYIGNNYGYEDNPTTAKVALYSDLDKRLGNLKNTKQVSILAGVRTEYSEFDSWTGWDDCTRDTYQYCIDNNIHFQLYAFSWYVMSALTADHMEWNELGQHWVNYTKQHFGI